MSRFLRSANNQITIEVMDEPGRGGANHQYQVQYIADRPAGIVNVDIKFQKGPMVGLGLNGITNEVLLAILIDRLEGFQRGPFACNDNADTLFYLQLAMDRLTARTRDRVARGVEGTHTP